MAHPHSRHTILIVDDSDDIREIVRDFLEGEGFEVSDARDGAAGLRALEGDLPCALILDLMMPVMDGWQVLERLRADPRTASLPVLVITAATERHLPAGVPVLRKPFTASRLLSEIERSLSCR